MRIVGGKVCGPNGIRTNCDVVVREGRLKIKDDGCPRLAGETVVEAGGCYILPGFIEIHTHGAGLFEFTMGKYDSATGQFDGSEDVYAREFPQYARLRASTGVTSLYLGTWASPIRQQQTCFRRLREYIRSAGNGRDGSRIAGGLLEGTFINPKMAGAQNPEFVFPPRIEVFDEINESGVIRLANVVPDYDDDSRRLIESLARRGISVGAGHTEANGDQFHRAMESGLKYCIHFLNGPIAGSFKEFNGGGGVEAVLREDLYAELIVDGVHVSPAYVRDVLARKGADRVMAVSDAMFASQGGGVRDFRINNIPGRVDDSGRYVYVVGKKPITLFSSVLTMDVACGNLLSWLTTEMAGAWHRRHTAVSFDEALTTAARCCATNIAEMLRRNGGDDLDAGEISDGKWADLVVAEIIGQPGAYQVVVRQVYVRGEKVWDRPDQGETYCRGGWQRL